MPITTKDTNKNTKEQETKHNNKTHKTDKQIT